MRKIAYTKHYKTGCEMLYDKEQRNIIKYAIIKVIKKLSQISNTCVFVYRCK